MRKILSFFLILVILFLNREVCFAAKESEPTDKLQKTQLEYTGFEAKRDPFGLPAALAKLLEKPYDSLEKQQAVTIPTVEIQGIISSRGMPQAIINNNVMKVGDYIGEFEIKSIGKDSIILFFQGKEYTINKQKNDPKNKKR